MKAIYFDMDGTIADLYGYKNWLELLRAEDTIPYEDCDVLVNAEELRRVLDAFITLGVTIGIISWGAMNGSREYCKRTRKAKKAWCEKHFPHIFTEFHVIKYGTPKHHVRKVRDSILVDDNADVRAAWQGDTIDANENIIELLKKVLFDLKKQKMFVACKNKIEQAEKTKLFSPLWKQHTNKFNNMGLYLIGQSSRNPITGENRFWLKVGLTTDREKRVKTYLTHCADVYFIDWHGERSHDIKSLESYYHTLLKNAAYDNRTEWFQVPEKYYLEVSQKGFSFWN
jgi:hypothetical protein